MSNSCYYCQKRVYLFSSPQLLCAPCWVQWWVKDVPLESVERETAEAYIAIAKHDLPGANQQRIVTYIKEIGQNQAPLKKIKNILKNEVF